MNGCFPRSECERGKLAPEPRAKLLLGQKRRHDATMQPSSAVRVNPDDPGQQGPGPGGEGLDDEGRPQGNRAVRMHPDPSKRDVAERGDFFCGNLLLATDPSGLVADHASRAPPLGPWPRLGV